MPNVFAAFMAAAGVILIVALLQESHRLAFRDELTGLPGRRALDERLRSLPGRYAVAMVDVDHFKKFNDTHGHDIGDQVLKLVGARLGRGGRRRHRLPLRRRGVQRAVPAQRPRRGASRTSRRCACRSSTTAWRCAASDRPKKAEVGAKQRGDSWIDAESPLGHRLDRRLRSPTASALRTPAQVIKAADEALYRAKQGGRNRVST